MFLGHLPIPFTRPSGTPRIRVKKRLGWDYMIAPCPTTWIIARRVMPAHSHLPCPLWLNYGTTQDNDHDCSLREPLSLDVYTRRKGITSSDAGIHAVMAFTRPSRHVAPLARSCPVRRHRCGAAKRAAFRFDGTVSTHRSSVDMDVHVDN